MSKYDFKEIENTGFSLWDYGWFDIIHCHVPGLSVDFIRTDLFAALLNHRIYREDYGSGSLGGTGDIHGPFVIECLSPSDFVEITAAELTEYLRARYADSENFYEPPDPAQIEAIDVFLNQLPKEGMRYFMMAVSHEDENYHHELWEIHTFFDEYILVNPQQESMWIIVLGYD
jgi:hypothetical protein